MSKINTDKMVDHLRTKWKNPCPMCGEKNWTVQENAYELREFTPGGIIIGGPIIPVVPVVCGNCGNTVLINALLSGAIDREQEVKK